MKKSFYLLAVILIACLGIVVYSNTFFCSFHFDDELHLIRNFAIKDIYDLPNIWNYYHTRFITLLSLAFNYHFNGLNVYGYHLFNLTIHLVSAILVWWLTLLTLSTPAMKKDKITQDAHVISIFAGLVFVSHPVQTEAVTYIWERAASMVAMFYLASLCFYIKSRLLQYPDPSSALSRFYYIGSLVTALLAMFTKENAITLPLMVLFYEFTFLKTSPGLVWSSSKRPFTFLLTLLVIPLTLLLGRSQIFQEHHGILRVPGGVITPMHYFLTQFRVMFTYIRLVFLPFHQNLDYDYPIYKNIFDVPVLISFLSLLLIFYWTKRLFSEYRLLSFSILWFFLTLTIPESSFWAMGDVIFEHRLYLPLVGYSIFLVGGIYYLFRKKSLKTMVIILTMIVACNSALTYQRNKVWKNELTLWDDAARKSPHKARPHNNRGIILAKEGNWDQAIVDFSQAIAIDPDNAEAFYNRGNVYASQGNFAQALSDYRKAIELNPSYAGAYYNRSHVYAIEGRLDQALSDATQAIELNPNADAYLNRGNIYTKENNFTRAIADYSKAIGLNPAYAIAYNNRAVDYYQLKNHDKARRDIYTAEGLGAAIDPGFLSALKLGSSPRVK